MENQEQNGTGYQVSIVSCETKETVKEFTVTKKQVRAILSAGGLLIGFLFVWAVVMTVLYGDRAKEASSVSLDLDQANSYTTQLEQRIEELEEQNTILGDTVNRNAEEAEIRRAEEEALYEPTGIPINGTVLYTEETSEEGQPYIEFTADVGAEVVAAGSGTILYVGEGQDWGYRVEIDHGNGYVTAYQVREEPKVKEGAEVRKGDILFIVTKSDRTILYEMLQNGTGINPMSIMEIYG